MTDEQIWSRYANAALGGMAVCEEGTSFNWQMVSQDCADAADAMLTAHRARFPVAEQTPVPETMDWPEALDAMKQGKTVKDRDGDARRMIYGAVYLRDDDHGDWKPCAHYDLETFNPSDKSFYWSGWTVAEAQDA